MSQFRTHPSPPTLLYALVDLRATPAATLAELSGPYGALLAALVGGDVVEVERCRNVYVSYVRSNMRKAGHPQAIEDLLTGVVYALRNEEVLGGTQVLEDTLQAFYRATNHAKARPTREVQG